MPRKQKHSKQIYNYKYKEESTFDIESESNDTEQLKRVISPKRSSQGERASKSRKRSSQVDIHSEDLLNQTAKHNVSEIIEERYQSYVNDIAQHIDQREEMVSMSVYDQQRENWTTKNEKLQEKIRQLKAQREDQNQKLAQYENNEQVLLQTIENLKDKKSMLKAKVDELESLTAEKDDEVEVISKRLKDLQNEYEAMNLTKDKMLESLQFAVNKKVDEVEEMKKKFEVWHEQLEELGKEYDTAIYEFTESNDGLLKRNEKLKAKCKEFLQQQMADMEERAKLLKKIQLLQKQKTMIRKQYVESSKTEVYHSYKRSDGNEYGDKRESNGMNIGLNIEIETSSFDHDRIQDEESNEESKKSKARVYSRKSIRSSMN
eukprot:197701_1